MRRLSILALRLFSALALLLVCGLANAQYWPARRMVAEVSTPTIVTKDKSGREIDRFQRAWVERSITVLDKLAPEYGIAAPALFITKDRGPNAFVTIAKNQPVMVINTDMLRLAGESDDMMAAVIGHELGHLKAQHVTQGAATSATIGLIGALLGAAVDANQAKHGRDTHGMGTVLGTVGAGLVRAKFSRDQEREADSLGINAMARAGYDPSASSRLWTLMAAKGGSDGLWMDSHPSHAEREQAMAALAQSLQAVYAANKPPESSLPSYSDPYPQPRYANFDPTPAEAAAQTAYQRGRVAYTERRFEDAVPLLREASEEGDERAMTLLGGMAQNGQGGQSVDLALARQHHETAASKGFGPAIGSLGYMALSGKGAEKNPAEAMRLFVLADSRNYSSATAALGMMYIEGNGTTKDPALSRRLAEKAANAGDSLGRALLGALLRDGLGGSADPARGFSLLSATAPKLGWASYQLGIAYERGQGTPVDREKAIEAYRNAASRGVSAAENRLRRLAPQ